MKFALPAREFRADALVRLRYSLDRAAEIARETPSFGRLNFELTRSASVRLRRSSLPFPTVSVSRSTASRYDRRLTGGAGWGPDGAAPHGAEVNPRCRWFVAEHRVGLSGDRTRESFSAAVAPYRFFTGRRPPFFVSTVITKSAQRFTQRASTASRPRPLTATKT